MADWTWRSYHDRRRGGAHELDGQVRDWAPENDLHYYREYLDKNVVIKIEDEKFFQGRPRELLTEAVEEAGSDSKAVRRAVQGTLGLAAQHARLIAESSRDRLRIFGDLASHDVAGTPYVQVMEVCDNQTCPICWERNGTIVPTGEAVAWVGRVVSAGPGKLDQTAPWIGESSVSDHRQYSSAELNTQGKALPLYHLRCRGMTNAYFGDPGNPGGGMRGGEDSRRRAELEKLYPAEIEERIRGIQSGAGWPESSRRGLDWHYEKHREDLELSTGEEWSLDQYQAESLRVIREADRVMTYHKPGAPDIVRWGFYESASGLYAAVDGQTGYIATCYRPEEMKFDDAVEVIK